VAKTRAQRKAEKRAREAQEQRQSAAGLDEVEAQHETQVPISGEVAEAEAVEAGIAAGAPESALETPDAPKKTKPSRSERRAAQRADRDSAKQVAAEQKRQESERIARKEKQASQGRRRGAVVAFIASCWAELKKVQWPDRETLVQASTVTVVFVAVAAAYLGALDAAFGWIVDRVL
jgi:preprotein translocase SecE subunit